MNENKDNKLNYISINGSISSLLATFCTYPLDTIKTRLQSNLNTTRISNLTTTQNLNLYKGLRYDMLSVIPSSFSYWYAYSYLRKKEYSIIESACTSSIISSIVDTPLDLYKKKAQLNVLNNSNIFKYCTMNGLVSLSFNLFYLNVFKNVLEKTDSTFLAITSASLVSGLISYPFDREKTMIVIKNDINNNTIKNIPFFKGLQFRLLYCFCYSCINMNILLYLNKTID